MDIDYDEVTSRLPADEEKEAIKTGQDLKNLVPDDGGGGADEQTAA